MRFPIGLSSTKQRGQVLVAFALVMVGFMLTLFVATLDLQALSLAYNRADTTAILAAQAGASGISDVTLYNISPLGGPILLDSTKVNTNCASVKPVAPQSRGFVSLTCTVVLGPTGSDYVKATVVWNPLFPVGLPGFTPKNLTLIRYGYPAFGCSNGTNGYLPPDPKTGCKKPS